MKTIKFQISELLGIGMTLVVLGIGLAYGLQVMGDVRQDMCVDGGNYYDATTGRCASNSSLLDGQGGIEFNATTDAMTGVAKIPEKLPTIVTVIVASVIIGILVTYLWARFR